MQQYNSTSEIARYFISLFFYFALHFFILIIHLVLVAIVVAVSVVGINECIQQELQSCTSSSIWCWSDYAHTHAPSSQWDMADRDVCCLHEGKRTKRTCNENNGHTHRKSYIFTKECEHYGRVETKWTRHKMDESTLNGWNETQPSDGNPPLNGVGVKVQGCMCEYEWDGVYECVH